MHELFRVISNKTGHKYKVGAVIGLPADKGAALVKAGDLFSMKGKFAGAVPKVAKVVEQAAKVVSKKATAKKADTPFSLVVPAEDTDTITATDVVEDVVNESAENDSIFN